MAYNRSAFIPENTQFNFAYYTCTLFFRCSLLTQEMVLRNCTEKYENHLRPFAPSLNENIDQKIDKMILFKC